MFLQRFFFLVLFLLLRFIVLCEETLIWKATWSRVPKAWPYHHIHNILHILKRCSFLVLPYLAYVICDFSRHRADTVSYPTECVTRSFIALAEESSVSVTSLHLKEHDTIYIHVYEC
jgi:hypothetical protein